MPLVPPAVNTTKGSTAKGWFGTSGYAGLVRVGEMSAAILYDWDFWTSSDSRNDIHGLHPPYESLAFTMRIDLVPGIKVPSTSMKLDDDFDEATPDGPIPDCGPPPTPLNRSAPNVLLIGDSISMGTGGDKYADGTWILLGYGWDVQLSLANLHLLGQPNTFLAKACGESRGYAGAGGPGMEGGRDMRGACAS